MEQRNLQMELEKAMPGGGRPSERGMRETIERVKVSVSEATGGLNGLEQVLRKFSAGENIS